MSAKKERWQELVYFALAALLIVIPIRLFIAQPYVVSGASMDPTFDNGDYLIVDRLSYHFEEPTRGSVVIFRFPLDPSRHYIKRVIGLPGETVSIKGTTVTITNPTSPGGFVLEEDYVESTREDSITVTLKEGEYFVMGDNRRGSSDSRIWGPVDENLIVGRPIVRLLPIGGMALFPGYAELK